MICGYEVIGPLGAWARRWICVGALGTLALAGGCSGGAPASGVDGSADASGLSGDAEPAHEDGGAPDARPPGCGDFVLQAGEACDGSELGGATCASLGLPAGTLACGADCTLDTAGCAVCGDAICSDAETAGSCPADCGVVDVAAGWTHTCAVLADGSVWCWGARDGHRMGGTGDVDVPVRLPGIEEAVAVSAGRRHTCVRTVLNEIYCWGANGYGQVGVAPLSPEVFPPVVVAEGRQVVTGRNHTCVRAEPTEIHCWGRVYAQPTTADAPVVLQGGGLLVAGGEHTCYTDRSQLRCLGWNDAGQLGLGDRAWRETGEPAYSSFFFVAAGAGGSHTCASFASGDPKGLYCWGSNEYGQLGLPPGPDELAPRYVSPLLAQVLDGGERHTCAKESPLPGPLYCFGDNGRGQLGTGSVVSGYEFQQVALDEVDTFDVGAAHTCAILPDHTLRCWGDNRHGQLGVGITSVAVPVPTAPIRLGPQEVTP